MRSEPIQIRTRFGGWKEVSFEQARAWVALTWSQFIARGWTPDTKRRYIEERVRGIDVGILMEGLQ